MGNLNMFDTRLRYGIKKMNVGLHKLIHWAELKEELGKKNQRRSRLRSRKQRKGSCFYAVTSQTGEKHLKGAKKLKETK